MTAYVFGRGDSNAIFIGSFTVDRAVSDGLSGFTSVSVILADFHGGGVKSCMLFIKTGILT